MPLIRISDQKHQTIEEFYQTIVEESESSLSRESCKAMLDIISKLNVHFLDNKIWCLTSLQRLVLLKEDNWKSPWYIIIACLGFTEYYIEYLMPDELKPWEGATVRGTTNTLEKAVEYVLLAMKNSGGWPNLYK